MNVSDYATDRFAHTLRVLIATVVLAPPSPVISYDCAWLLALAQDQPEVTATARRGGRLVTDSRCDSFP